MSIMECRLSGLECALKGYYSSKIPLVSSVNGTYFPAGFSDDLGIYYFVPPIAKFLGITIDQAACVFLGSLLLIGLIVSISCFFFMFKHWISRFISITGLILLAVVSYRCIDVYVASYFIVAIIVPFLLLWQQKAWKFSWKFLTLLGVSGILIGYANFMRSHAGTGAFLFLLSWIVLNNQALKKEKVLQLITLTLFTIIPYIHFQILEMNRDHFLVKTNPSYQPAAVFHPKWHSIYIGLGYLENPYDILYDDSIAYNTAIAINPSIPYCSKEYEQVLKDQCLLMLKKNPIFVVKNVLFKTLKLLLRFLIFANIGLFLAIFYVKPFFRLWIPFLFSSLFYALPGVLTMPYNAYVLGMVSMATLFGISMICLAVEKYENTLSKNF